MKIMLLLYVKPYTKEIFEYNNLKLHEAILEMTAK